MSLCMIEAIAWLVVGYLWTCIAWLNYVVTRGVMTYDVSIRVLICWHESCELIGIYVFIDITFQLMHGLKCMSRHVHIALI